MKENSKLKILHIIPSLAKGGAERLVLDVCNELNKRDNVDVRLLNFRDKNDYTYLCNKINRVIVDSHVVPSIFGKNKIQITDYLNYVNSFKPHIIHSHVFEAEIVSREVIFPEIVYITHLHDNMPQFKTLSLKTFFNKERFTNYYEKLKMLKKYRKCNNHFIAISKDTYDYFAKCLPHNLHNLPDGSRGITLMHNAIDFNRFARRDTIVNHAAPPDPIRLVTTGSLVDKKNQAFLVDVVKILTDKGLDIQLDVLGDGPNREKIQTKINENGSQGKITLQGNVNNVEDYLHKAHIYVHPATYEPFGLALLEAMAAGLPCVALDAKGNRDVVIDGYNGYMIMQHDYKQFAEKVIELIENKQTYQQLSANAVNTARKFDIVQYANKLMDYYYSISKKQFYYKDINSEFID